MMEKLEQYLLDEMACIVEDLNAVMDAERFSIEGKKQLAAVYGARWDEARKIWDEVQRIKEA